MRLSGRMRYAGRASRADGWEPEAAERQSGALTPERAAALLVRRAGAGRPLPDLADVDRLVRMCAYLPLTVGLVAALLRADPNRTVADLADQFDRARRQHLDLGGAELAVAAAFDLAYRDLPATGQRLMRCLGLHPGPDFDVSAAAALGNLTLLRARQTLTELCERHLIAESGTRYRIPGVLTEHARRLTADEPAVLRAAALDRLAQRGPM